MKSHLFALMILSLTISTLYAMQDHNKEMAARTKALIEVQQKRNEVRWAQLSEKPLTLPQVASSDSGPTKRAGTPRPPSGRSGSFNFGATKHNKPVIKQLTAGSGSSELLIVEEE